MSAPKLTDKPAETLPVQRILKEVSRRIVGQDAMVERLLVGLLTGGHILLEGVPGLAKTLAVRDRAMLMTASSVRRGWANGVVPNGWSASGGGTVAAVGRREAARCRGAARYRGRGLAYDL